MVDIRLGAKDEEVNKTEMLWRNHRFIKYLSSVYSQGQFLAMGENMVITLLAIIPGNLLMEPQQEGCSEHLPAQRQVSTMGTRHDVASL